MIARLLVKAGTAAILAGLLLAGTVSCVKPNPAANAGQAGGGELDVAFHARVSKKAANEVVRRCTADNPHVIRTTALQLADGNPRTYTLKVFVKIPISGQATNQLTSCFNDDTAVASAAWPV